MTNTLFSEQVMNQIRAIMKKYNIKNRELAREMGVSDVRVHHIFQDGSNLTLKSVDQVHQALFNIVNRRPPVPIIIDISVIKQ